MIGLEFLSRVSSIKNLYLKKNNFSSYHGSFVITKNDFVLNLITSKLKATHPIQIHRAVFEKLRFEKKVKKILTLNI